MCVYVCLQKVGLYCAKQFIYFVKSNKPDNFTISTPLPLHSVSPKFLDCNVINILRSKPVLLALRGPKED